MNYKGILYYLGFFCFPISAIAFINILYSSYSNYFLSLESYTTVLFLSLFIGIIFLIIGRKKTKKIEFVDQILLIILVYITSSIFISLPFYLSNYQIPFINSLFESVSGITGTGFTIFDNIKYLDPTLIFWRSISQWVGGLYFLIFLVIFFSNNQYNFKLNNLVYIRDKNINQEINIKKNVTEVFSLYIIFSAIIFSLFSIADIRLFNSLNLAMTIISAGGFIPTDNLQQIIKTNTQEIFLIISFLITTLNIFFFYNIFTKRNFLKTHYEDLTLLSLIIFLGLSLYFILKEFSLLQIFISVLSSLSTSGISVITIDNKYTLFFLFLSIIGGSIVSNTSGIKFIRFFILLKSSLIEIFKLVKPNNIINQNLLLSEHKINIDNIKLSFFIFISFFISVFFLSSLLLLDNINFENSLKIAMLTITNTVSSGLYGIDDFSFVKLLTSSKIFIIIFMIIGKIELISIFLLIKIIFFKN